MIRHRLLLPLLPKLLLPLLPKLLLPLALACSGSGGSDAARPANEASPAPEASAAAPAVSATATTPAAVSPTSTLAPSATSVPSGPAPTLAAAPVATSTPVPTESQGALSSAPAPARGGTVQGSINLSTAASCNSSNGVARARLTARANATGGFVRRVTVLLDDVIVADSGDVSGQSLTSLERVADLTPAAGTHSVRVVGESTGGATSERTGTLTIVNGGCSLRI